MSLLPGTRLGPYEVVAQIGVGGMGEVYRATDTNLKRAVAVKVLPASVATDAERLARFQREAEVLAALNHPNIAAIYGLERSGATTALVMELVEGPTLADRVAKGAIPVDEALHIARQIAEALESAHEQGIIHRDLKPANIKVRPDGTVKVLDFGLAKAMEPVAAAPPSVTMSPTITTPAMTEAGMILGTAAYMSPEQARGKTVDKRSDIWAFGAVVYEMLTGTSAFDSANVQETFVAIMRDEPDWARLPATLPVTLAAYLRRCLQKDPKHRIHDIADMRLALEGAFETDVSPGGGAAGKPGRASWRHALALTGAALVIAIVTGALVWVATRAPEPVPPRLSHLSVPFSSVTALTVNDVDRDLAITPDGSRIVYDGNNGTQLVVRALDTLEPVVVFTGRPRGPFVSPDGQWIGFVDNNSSLKKVAVTGGPTVTLATLDSNGPRGATWGPDDAIIFATSNVTTGLQRVAASGTTTVLTRPDRAQGEADHLWPEMLPGGRAVLFTATALTGGLDAAQVAVLDLQTGARKIVLRGGSHAHYVPSGRRSATRAERESGHLVYGVAGTLRAVAFDLARLETLGTPVPVVPDVVTTGIGGLNAVVADDGTLAYVTRGGGVTEANRTLVWVDREGRETPVPAPARAYQSPRLSPDGTRIAVNTQDHERDLWLWDLRRTTLTRLTFDPDFDGSPVWTPDGRRVIFNSEGAGARNLFWRAVDGTGAVERLSESANTQGAAGVSPDGQLLVFSETTPNTREDLMQLTLDETRRVTPLVQSSFSERNGVISPDGHWLAYEANDSGRFEISVRPFPGVNNGHWQVSTDGGTRPLWARSGRELFFVSSTGSLMRVGVNRGSTWTATTPTVLIKEGYSTIPSGNPNRTYDISPDGLRFLMIKEGGVGEAAAPPQLVVVQNWTEELKRLAPRK